MPPENASATEKVENQDKPSKICVATPLDVLRYRYHHGVNLGGCFVLEKWLTPNMFPQGADTSELAGVTASINQFGLSYTRAKWEAHWQDMLKEADLDWLVQKARCTTIRLPIGYWTLGPLICQKTPFHPASAVYANAWNMVQDLIIRARAKGIGTLIDLHGLPGGANASDHSGTNSGEADLWGNQKNLELAGLCIACLAYQIKKIDGVVGFQLCNEAMYDAPGLYRFYEILLDKLHAVDASIPIYISDGWDLNRALSYSQSANTIDSTSSVNPVVVDTHMYCTFADSDKAKSPHQIIEEVPTKLSELKAKTGNVVDHGAAEIMIGEYSCAMSRESLTKSLSPDIPNLTKELGQAQTALWQASTGGSCFWTLKLDKDEWSFVQQTNIGSITPPKNLTLSISEVQTRILKANQKQKELRTTDLQTHEAYCSKAGPDTVFEHWRYERGWDIGFSDAMKFFSMRSKGIFGTDAKNAGGGDKIGYLELWVLKRITESGMVGSFVWEFEYGLRKGIQSFYDAAEI